MLHAPAADLLLVTARTSGAPDAEAGPLGLRGPGRHPGGEASIPYPTIDGQRGADVVLSGVELPAEALLGAEGEAFPALAAAFDLGVAALCAEAVGVLQATLDATTEYTRTRKQFGVPIARFQALQHRMADMLMHVEQARSMSYLAAMHAASGDVRERRRDRLRGQGDGGAGLPVRGAAGGPAPRRDGGHRRARGEPLLQAAHGHRAVARRHRAPPGAIHHGEQMSQAHYTTRGAVAVITLDNPPVNGLGYELRSGLVAGLDRAAADPAVKAVVITGAGKAFSGGADIKEFDSPEGAGRAQPPHRASGWWSRAPSRWWPPSTPCAWGGGLELSLGCHYRVASPGAQIALPEVKLGLLPGAGGTQRLPRVVGIEAAANMIASGTPVPSEKLAGTKLFDALIDGDLLDGAVAFAEKVADVRPLPLVRNIPLKDPRAPGFLAFARNTVSAMAKDYPAPRKCVDAVEVAATKPFEEGLAWERAAFVGCVQTPESRALRHAFFAERAASKIPDVPEDTPTRPIKVGRGHRRRHHGRRHRHELRQRRHPGDGARGEGGGAPEGARRHPQELRGHRRRRGRSPRPRWRSAWRSSAPPWTTPPSARPTSWSRRSSRTWR